MELRSEAPTTGSDRANRSPVSKVARQPRDGWDSHKADPKIMEEHRKKSVSQLRVLLKKGAHRKTWNQQLSALIMQ
eukprot:121520-Pyramimonas_sp.AAC.1